MEKAAPIIAPFLDEQGRITALPKKEVKRAAVLDYLIQKFESNRDYTEKEINDICLAWHTFNDYFLLRRSLVEARLLLREPNGSRYWRNKEVIDACQQGVTGTF